MPTTMYSLSLSRRHTGIWSLTPSDSLTEHPVHPLPPMAFPASMSDAEAQAYAQGFLPLAHVPAPAALDWHVYGYRGSDRAPAYRAAWSVTVSNLSPSPKGA